MNTNKLDTVNSTPQVPAIGGHTSTAPQKETTSSKKLSKLGRQLERVALAAPTLPPEVVFDSRSTPPPVDGRIGLWHVPATITENAFIHKSLSDWAVNGSIGCLHGCLFCYVPDASAIKQGKRLKQHGVEDPDAEWGQYLQLRPWDEKVFMTSLRAAENRPDADLKPDGNRAVMFSSTTDPYQVVRHEDPARQRELNEQRRLLIRRPLELIRDYSTLRVRILTRSPLAREDFELYKTFGPRLLFGMSLPTLRNDLARIYEPKAPAPSQRIATLRAAKAAGLNVYVAIAPTYPECDDVDLRATLKAVAELDPVTVFHEPINMRAENVERIRVHAESLGVKLNTEVYETPKKWRAYALGALHSAERIAGEVGLADRLHLWPDPALGTVEALTDLTGPAALEHSRWLYRWWDRVSEWPTA